MSEKSTPTYVLAFSIFCLAVALVYFTVKISLISEQIPDVLASVDNTSTKIEPVVEQIHGIRDLVPPILEELRKTRELVPGVLTEVAQTRDQVPLILEEVKNTRQQLPAILEATNKASDSAVTVAGVVEKALPLVPDTLEQVEKTREAIPAMMDRAEQLIGQAKDAGREASKGAVTGVLAGIITAPFALIGNTGKKFLGDSSKETKLLHDADYAIMVTALNELISTNKINEIREWKNPASNIHGRLTLKVIGGAGSNLKENCRQIYAEFWDGDKSLLEELVTACQNENGEWIKQQ